MKANQLVRSRANVAMTARKDNKLAIGWKSAKLLITKMHGEL